MVRKKLRCPLPFFSTHLFYNQTHLKISYVKKRKQTPLHITLLNSLPYFITQKGT